MFLSLESIRLMFSLLLLSLPMLGGVTLAASHGRRADSKLNSTYLSPAFGQSQSNIYGYAKQSIQALLKTTDSSTGQFTGDKGGLFYWPSQNAWTAVAQWDFQQGTKDFHDQVSAAQKAMETNTGGGYDTWKVPLVNYYNDDSGWAALANVQAYEAYGDDVFLQRAVGVWKFLTDHGYISQSVIDTGYVKGTKYPSNTVKGECNGKTMIGGVYWENGGPDDPNAKDAASDPGVNAVSTGLYSLLSADLCRITKNSSYCDTAYTSTKWLDNHMLAPDGLIWDHLDGRTCEVTKWEFTYNVGLYIATYAQLGYIKNDTAATASAKAAIDAALHTPLWNDPKGIIKEGKGDVTKSDDGIGFKSIMIRYLNRASEWITDDDLKAAIQQYINIQYYALTQLDSDSKSHPVNYGRNWEGPYNVSTIHAQVAAMDVLVGLDVNPSSVFPPSTDTTKPVSSV